MRKAAKTKGSKNSVRKSSKLPRKKTTASSRQARSGYSPRIVVKYRDDVVLPYDKRVDRALDELADGRWRRLKQRFAGISIRVLIDSIPPSRIRQLVAEAMRQDDAYRPPNFLTYYVVDIPSSIDRDELIKELNAWRIVDTAYFDAPSRDPHRRVPGIVSSAPLLSAEDPLMFKQGYLGPAEAGIDAHFAWNIPGGQGEGTRFIDLEQGWTLDHVDLVGHGAQVQHGASMPLSRPHGTKVLGVVCARRNTKLCRGVAPKVSIVNVMSYSGNFFIIANVIKAAIAKLQRGDVLLLEVEKPIDENAAGPCFPVEFFQAEFDAIKLATTLGIIVVEAAGNHSVHLDSLRNSSGIRVFAPGAPDSGAILVGAATSSVPHTRLGISNFGSRVDCYAWGENVFTLSSSQFPTSGKFDTTRTERFFNGTSSAAAIIAGAALVVQGVANARSAGTVRLDATQMRQMLSNRDTGTKSQPPHDGIGVMPDLRKILSGIAFTRLVPIVAPPGT